MVRNRLFLLLFALFSAVALCQTTPQPKVFEPGVISDGSYTTSAEFTPDGNTVYFLRGPLTSASGQSTNRTR